MAAITNKINVNTKHLKKGDPLPPYNGKLRVYNTRYCPFAHRIILALNAKNVDYEVVNINLVDKPEWMQRKSAFSKIPSIEIKEDVCVCESLIMVEYIEEVYPQRPLLSKDPVKRAFDKIIAEASAPMHTIFFKMLCQPDLISDEHIRAYQNALAFIQDQLKERGTSFLGGDEPGYADYMIWPWFERLLVFREFDQRCKIDTDKFKLLMAYLDKMLKDPVVSQYLIPDDIMAAFFKSYKNGAPDYSMLDEN